MQTISKSNLWPSKKLPTKASSCSGKVPIKFLIAICDNYLNIRIEKAMKLIRYKGGINLKIIVINLDVGEELAPGHMLPVPYYEVVARSCDRLNQTIGFDKGARELVICGRRPNFTVPPKEWGPTCGTLVLFCLKPDANNRPGHSMANYVDTCESTSG